MFYLDAQSASPAHKTVFSIACLAGLLAAALPIIDMPTRHLHDEIFYLLLVIYFLRLQVTVWVFQKRQLTWIETLIISAVMPLAFYSFSEWNALPDERSLWLELSALALYGAGSFINTAAEYARYRWKQSHPGQLYTRGLFGYARHINFFGEIMLFVGLALFTGRLAALAIPLIMTLNFLGFVIPALDAYLRQKYGDDYVTYARTTRQLVPYLY